MEMRGEGVRDCERDKEEVRDFEGDKERGMLRT